MMKHAKRVLVILILLTAVIQVPLAHAQGGMVFNPYWTYETEAPVTHVAAGDINGDGLPEVVILTANNLVHVLENDGSLAWRYETDFAVAALAVADLEGDQGADEILVGGEGTAILLRDGGKPACVVKVSDTNNLTAAADLDGDGRREQIYGTASGKVWSSTMECNQRWYKTVGLSVIDIWSGDLDGDGRAEIVPSPTGGQDVYVLEDGSRVDNVVSQERVESEDEVHIGFLTHFQGHVLWQARLEREVGLVQGGDVDGDDQAEVVVLSASGELFLLDNDGGQVWRNQAISPENIPDDWLPGQLVVCDLGGDGPMEIIVTTSRPTAAIHVFDGAGRQVWQHALEAVSSPARLMAGDVNGDGTAEVMVTTEGQAQVYLLSAVGDRLAEYRLAAGAGKTTGALDYADLNGDGWREIIVGTKTGVQIFGASEGVVRRQLWQSARLGLTVLSVFLHDLDGDGLSEVVATSDDGQVHILANDGRLLSNLTPELPSWALGAGDTDGDDRGELVVASTGSARQRLQLLDGDRPVWTARLQGLVTGLAAIDLDGDKRTEFILGSRVGSTQGFITVLDAQGEQIWQQDYGDPVTAVSSSAGQILVGTASGQVYRLGADGSPIGGYELGAEILNIGEGLVATADGRVYGLEDDAPTLVHQLEEAPTKVQISASSIVAVNEKGQASLVANDGASWPLEVDGLATSIATGDLNSDGTLEVAIGTDNGRIHLFGLTLDQPPILTKPDWAETRTGYAYSIHVNDPEGDVVPVELEIWDPSADSWLTQPAQSLPEGQGQGRLSWDVPEPFDMWDSGMESRFRFRYSDGQREQLTAEIPGPFTIPTTPWYVYYGQRVGLVALVLMIPALGLVLYRRQRAYRLSPVGQAEALLKELRAKPDEPLVALHDLARNNSTLLTYLPGLAREAGDTALADLGESLYLILTRPEVTAEGLRTLVAQLEQPSVADWSGSANALAVYRLAQTALEANSIAQITHLLPELQGAGSTPAGPGDAQGDLSPPPLPPGVDAPDGFTSGLADALAQLYPTAEALHAYERVDTSQDKLAYLASAVERLGHVDRLARTELGSVDRPIIQGIAKSWLAVVTGTMSELQTRAQLVCHLLTRHTWGGEVVTLALNLRNDGRGVALNVKVRLAPAPEYTLVDEAATVERLAPGEETPVELRIRPRLEEGVDQFRACFVIVYADPAGPDQVENFADVVHLLATAGEFQYIPNPYVVGTPLQTNSPLFFGREDLLAFIQDNLAAAHRNNLVLIGQRRTGKTSLLKQLPARLGEGYLPVYLDGQTLGLDPGLANFCLNLAMEITFAMEDHGLHLEPPELDDFSQSPTSAFEHRFLAQARAVMGERHLLVMLDEFEALETAVQRGDLGASVFGFLRHLIQHTANLSMIFCGTHRLEELVADHWNVLFNISLYRHVAYLERSEAWRLIQEPVATYGLRYDDLALDKMWRVTAGHPYFLQLLCHSLVNRHNQTRRNYVTVADVNVALEEILATGEAHFIYLWTESTRAERLALTALSRMMPITGQATPVQVVDHLAEHGIKIERLAVGEALHHLALQDILSGGADPDPTLGQAYRWQLGLLGLWVEKYKSLSRVIDEVG